MAKQTVKNKEAVGLKLKSKAKLIRSIMLFVVFVSLSAGLLLFGTTLQEWTAEKQIHLDSYNQLMTDVTQKRASVNSLQSKLTSSEIDFSGEKVTAKQFVDFTGSICETNELKVNKLTGGESVSSDGVSKMNYEIEIEGSGEGLKNFITQIEETYPGYTVKSVSFREAADQSWLLRGIDEQRVLSWWSDSSFKDYQDTIMQEAAQILSEYNRIVPAITGEEGTTTEYNQDYLTAAQAPTSEQINAAIAALNKITVAQLLQKNDMTMYLNIDFINVV